MKRIKRLRASLLAIAVVAGCQSQTPQKVQLPGGAGSPSASPAPAVAAPSPAGSTDTAAPASTPTATIAPGTAATAAATAASPTLPPLAARPVADLIAAGNLDGEGDDEIICWSQGRLSFWTLGEEQPYEVYQQPSEAEQKILGAPGMMLVRDLDGDGRQDLLLGYGMSRTAQDVPVTVALMRIKGKSGMHRRTFTTLYQAQTPRAQVTGLAVADLEGDPSPELLVAHFDSKYFVSAWSLSLKGGAAALEGLLPSRLLGRVRMATSWAAADLDKAGKAEVVVGRPYGEEKVAPGDIFVLKGEQRERIPSLNGVRSLTLGDGDGDRKPEVWFGDGWHFEYGTKARGRLSVARKTARGWQSELIDDTRGQYEIKKIEVADVDSDGKPEVIAAGNRYINLYWKTPKAWMARKLSDGEDFALARINGARRLVVAGNPVSVVSLEDARKGGVAVTATTPIVP